MFHDMAVSMAGSPDGMKVDVEGRVYCTGAGGVWVFDHAGNHHYAGKAVELCLGRRGSAEPLHHGHYFDLQNPGQHVRQESLEVLANTSKQWIFG